MLEFCVVNVGGVVAFFTPICSLITEMANTSGCVVYQFEMYISESSRSSLGLAIFEKYVLVLMRLGLNLSIQDLTYRSKVSKSTVSRTFCSVVHVAQ